MHLRHGDNGHLLHNDAGHLVYECGSSESSSSSFGYSSSSSTEQHELYVQCLVSSSSSSEGISESSSSGGFTSESSSSEGNHGYVACESSSSSSEGYSESSSTSDGISSSSDSESSSSELSESSSSDQYSESSSSSEDYSESSSSSEDPESESSSSSGGCPTGLKCNCPGPSGAPTIDVTMSWTDSDETKTMFGCEWCNGETKEVCPDLYTCSTSTPKESWIISGTASQIHMEAFLYSAGPPATRMYADCIYGNPPYAQFNRWFFGTAFTNSFSYTSQIASENINSSTWTRGHQIVDGMFGSITDNNGVTISWAKHSGSSWGC